MDFFEKQCPGTFEWVPAKIYSNNTLIETEHKLLHITNHSKEGIFFYNKESLRNIWVEEAFMKKYKKEKSKRLDFLSRRILVPYLMLSKDNIYQYSSNNNHTAYHQGGGKCFPEESHTDKYRHNRLKSSHNCRRSRTYIAYRIH